MASKGKSVLQEGGRTQWLRLPESSLRQWGFANTILSNVTIICKGGDENAAMVKTVKSKDYEIFRKGVR